MERLFALLDPVTEARRAELADTVGRSGAFSEFPRPPQPERFSLLKLIDSMATGAIADEKSSYEASVVRMAATLQGSYFDPSRVVVPWGVIAGRRDLAAAGAPSAGGFVVGSNTVTALDVLRPFSATARMGLSSVEGLTTNLLYPNASSAVTGQWLPTETTQIVAADGVLGQAIASPRNGGAIVKATYQFMKQGRQQAETFIRQQLLGAAGSLLDQAVLRGTGASGQPTGLSVAPGVGAQSGAVTAANMLDILQTLGTANVNDDNIKFLTTPAVRRLLQAREVVSTSGKMIWERNQVADKPGFVSTDVPAATIFAGDWSQCLVALWGTGLELQIDPYTDFRSGAVTVRVFISADVVWLKPAAFVRHTTVS